ncbi:MAG TPA: hypothetical protein VMW89_05930 [Desulfatiglandales bacterium]|nr:hypothetical protein [Desulfatiglandales bacterium]
MQKMLKRLFVVLTVLSVLTGLFIKPEHVVFLWHKIPSIDAGFGALGTCLLIVATRILASFARKKEGFYD